MNKKHLLLYIYLDKAGVSYLRRFSLVCIALLSAIGGAYAQAGTWTWISGDSLVASSGVFGVQGIPSANNHPPGLYEPCEWKDKQGNFWLYGGWTPDVFSDMWKYNPATNEWTWVKGTGFINQPAVYGTQAVANIANTPGNRAYAAATWVDTSGALWLFGGSNSSGYQNDLWRYDIGTDEWTWMKGNTVGNAAGSHGTQGMASASNLPGTRAETCSAWTDSLNNLWLFGGLGYDDNGNNGMLNDLWKYSVLNNEWTWIKGSAYVNAASNYGARGVAGINNDPGARVSYTKWKDTQGNLWLMGGMDQNYNVLNDVWRYDISANEWTWMNGPNVVNDAGKYISTCVFDNVERPYSRMEQRSSVTDNCGRFWMFAGQDYVNNNNFNDLWVFDPQQLEWNRVKGTNIPNLPGNYNNLGIASPGNMPPARFGAVSWWGNNNRFYVFGGAQSYCYSDLWVFEPDTSCIAVCGSTDFPPPVADFEASKTTLCANDCIDFTDLSTNAASWQWSFAGGSPATSTDQNPQNVCYLTAGVYNVTLVVANSGGSTTLTLSSYINVNPSPPSPSITQVNMDTLVCTYNASYISYQWYYQDTLLAGDVNPSLAITKSGNYNVEVTAANGCKSAAGINVIIGLQNYSNDNIISIYPNPVGDRFTVYGLRFTSAYVNIYNLLGQVVSQSEIEKPKSEIDVSSLPSGLYFIEVVSKHQNWLGRFVKE